MHTTSPPTTTDRLVSDEDPLSQKKRQEMFREKKKLCRNF